MARLPSRRSTPVRSGVPLAACLLLCLAAGLAAGCGGGTLAAPAGERLDLAALFPVAEVAGQPWRLDLGTPGARPHLVQGWSYDDRRPRGGEPALWSIGRDAVLEFFVAAPVDFALVLEGSTVNLPGAPQRVDAFVGDRPIGSFVLGPEPADHVLAVPAAALRPGTNRLHLRFAWTAVPREVGLGTDGRALAGHWQGVRFVGLGAAGTARVADGDDGPPRLVIPRQREVVWYLDAAPGSVLEIADLETIGHGGELLVTLGDGDGDRARHRFAAGEAPIRLTLPATGDGPLRLALAAVGGRASRFAAAEAVTDRAAPEVGVAVVSPAVVSPARRVAAGADGGDDGETADDSRRRRAGPRPGRPLPDVVVYLVDTLRADRLGLYGYHRPTSPELERFAADAVTFLDAQAQTSWTRPAVASLLTGLVPQAHGVTGRLDALPDAVTTLPERLYEAGYQTVGFITNGNVAAEFAMNQGFETYRRLPEWKERPWLHVPARGLGRKALEWLDRKRDPERPLFLYLHASDPHAPYMPFEPFRSRFAAGVDPALGALDHVQSLPRGELQTAAEDRGVADLYDAEVAQNDAAFGQLLDGLERRGLYRDAIVVFVADHGEELLDHGGWEHGITLYREQLAVPLVIKLPGGAGAGRRVTTLVQQVDLAPTLLDLLGLDVPPGLDGTSLRPLLTGRGELPERLSHAHLAVDQHTVEAVTGGRWKLIHDRGEHGGAARLYARGADPAELIDESGEEAFTAGLFRQHLRTHRWALRERSVRSRQVDVSDELEDNLRALGYLQ